MNKIIDGLPDTISRSMKHYIRKMLKGKCVRCTKKAAKNSRYCKNHKDYFKRYHAAKKRAAHR
jgi:hypothetical protein